MISVGNVVTLENGFEYLILEELEKDGKKYVYAVKTLEDDNLTDEYIVFEAIIDENGEFIKTVTDKDLYDQLLDEFSDVVADKILSADIPDEEVE